MELLNLSTEVPEGTRETTISDSHEEYPRGDPLSLASLLDTPAKRWIVRFFQQNRYTMDTADGLAIWTGLSREKAAGAAEALVNAHLLDRIGEGDAAVYLPSGGLLQGILTSVDMDEIQPPLDVYPQ